MNTTYKTSAIRVKYGFFLLVIIGLIVGAIIIQQSWSNIQKYVLEVISSRKNSPSLDEHDHGAEDAHAGHDHAGHEHAHDAGSSLELSAQAMNNIGLTTEYLRPVVLKNYLKKIVVPAIVKERPGRTKLEVSSPVSGVITHVHALQGESVVPGNVLFEIRITAEEFVTTQTQMLKTLGDLEVEQKEINRLSDIANQGGIAQKTLLEHQYARDKLQVLLSTQKEALRLQGINERQIEDIIKNKRLFSTLQIIAPAPDQHGQDELHLTELKFNTLKYASMTSQVEATSQPDDFKKNNNNLMPAMIMQEVQVHKGQTVRAGDTLAEIYDLSELLIEGRGFEQDLVSLTNTSKNNWSITAIFEQVGQNKEFVHDLKVLYSANVIDEETRTLSFYVALPNHVIKETPSPNGLNYIEWKYRPGQRLQLQIPIEEWQEQIILPVDAVALEGVESFVFLQNGKHFDRVPVHIVYRDQFEVVIKNDGSIFHGDIVAYHGAHQMQMALKNKSGGGVDPHAGHNH